MPPVKTAVPPQAAPIYDAYLGCLAARGVGNKTLRQRRPLLPGPVPRPAGLGGACRWRPGWRAPARSCSRC